MPPSKKYNAAEDLLENVLKRSRYSSKTLEDVSDFLENFGGDAIKYAHKLEAKIKGLKRELAKLQTK